MRKTEANRKSLPTETRQHGTYSKSAAHQAEGRSELQGNQQVLCSAHTIIKNERGKIMGQEKMSSILTKGRLEGIYISLLKGHAKQRAVNIPYKISNGKKKEIAKIEAFLFQKLSI